MLMVPWLIWDQYLLVVNKPYIVTKKKKCIQDVKTQFVVAYPNVSQVYLIKTTPFENY